MPGLVPPAVLEGPVTLTALQVSDWALDQALSQDPEVVKWTYYPADLAEASARHRIERALELAGAGKLRRYAIRGADHQPLGTCGLVGLDAVPELFYAVLAEHRGRGVATAAVSMLADWVLTHGADEVALETIVGNRVSERVAERAGFAPRAMVDAERRGEPIRLRRWVRTA